MIIKEDYFTMSDDVKLYTRMVLPDNDNKFQIVFMRSPFEESRNGIPCPEYNYENKLFFKNGYAIVIQHVRGTGDNEGECRPYHEPQDGLNTLEINRQLPFIFVYGNYKESLRFVLSNV